MTNFTDKPVIQGICLNHYNEEATFKTSAIAR